MGQQVNSAAVADWADRATRQLVAAIGGKSGAEFAALDLKARVLGITVFAKLADDQPMLAAGKAALAVLEAPTADDALRDYAEGINQPFCACGRRWSECDRSRSGCARRLAK